MALRTDTKPMPRAHRTITDNLGAIQRRTHVRTTVATNDDISLTCPPHNKVLARESMHDSGAANVGRSSNDNPTTAG
jgi:hypothetical protein